VHDDPGQPCWQYPHGTSSHVGQPVAVAGAAVVGFGASVGSLVGTFMVTLTLVPVAVEIDAPSVLAVQVPEQPFT